MVASSRFILLALCVLLALACEAAPTPSVPTLASDHPRPAPSFKWLTSARNVLDEAEDITDDISEKTGLTTGVIIAIAVGAAIFLIVMVVLCCCCCCF
ncbi:unnamed protein product [Chondrus crispus]|uniref:Uncharacterized protein n=1 Tax=Chondrus crispus TaxID=2769 RepID=R7QJ65_CHOCR|nr:unnamed protein product [Chondrus crispus]CDF37813.1 unnamed protein product [Chondrus crispus]|eukprot:XP_005717684.1 unnamed protein product [Chondrus crispus]